MYIRYVYIYIYTYIDAYICLPPQKNNFTPRWLTSICSTETIGGCQVLSSGTRRTQHATCMRLRATGVTSANISEETAVGLRDSRRANAET